MPSNEQKALDATDKIGEQKKSYRAAALALQDSVEEGAPRKKQVRCIRELHEQATAFFDCVEAAISKSELLGANQSENWATDLANTAYNVLDNVVYLYERLWRSATGSKSRTRSPAPVLSPACRAPSPSTTKINARNCRTASSSSACLPAVSHTYQK